MTPLKLPPVYLLPTHLEPEQLHDLERRLGDVLTYDINEAEVIVGRITRLGRALFELRHHGVATTPVGAPNREPVTPAPKTRDLADTDDPSDVTAGGSGRVVRVVRLAWLIDSFDQETVLPVRNYIVYEGWRVGDALHNQINPSPTIRHPQRKHTPALVHQTTSEDAVTTTLRPIPPYLHTTYSCQRPTPINPPNARFIDQLVKIRTTRLLNDDRVGVRAYSTSIATLSAYPYVLQTAAEVERLPGCGAKLADLFREWRLAGSLREVDEAESNPRLQVLRLFYDIWGVGDATAREFYNIGWRDLDDLVEHGWDNRLSRVQQIGVKYYNEFKLKIPRSEVESIGAVILAHARQFNGGFQMMIVGGHRRGKPESGDVDVLLSHPSEAETSDFIEKLVLSLEKSHLITHTLTLSTGNSQRGQMPVSWKGEQAKSSPGFDTLDKAMVVWQSPSWINIGADAKPQGESLQPHRRVDIIISPFSTVGCAVLGWSGGTTFQRDLRRYCKKERGLKFDSSGIRCRADGLWVDLEGGPRGRAPDMETAEKRVFAGLGLEYIPPAQRCTG